MTGLPIPMETRVTETSLRDAGIASSMAANPNAIPEPSVYFQDFNFGATMWDAAYGNVDGGSVSGVGDGVADIAIDNVLALEEKRRKEDDPAKDASMIVEAGEQQREALARMQARSAELGREIAQMESQFEAEMGDAWREIFANDILDPDQAQRHDGETMEQYRARLEIMLTAEMLDNNGNIKPEYVDHPLARWAQAQNEKAQIDRLRDDIENNPNATPEYVAQRINKFDQIATNSERIRAAGELTEGTAPQIQLAESVDATSERVEISGAAETSAEDAVFSTSAPTL